MVHPNPLAMRMKDYEWQIDPTLPSQTWAVIRLDGRAFHTYTRGLARPFDQKFMSDMVGTMEYLCLNVGGVRFAYTQSDEISLVITDLNNENAQLWFGGKVQKIVSVAASLAGAVFNRYRSGSTSLAAFDARVFALPSAQEVENYLRWRQQDARRNGLFMAASEFYSHKDLHGRSASEKIAMLAEAGHPWESYSARVRLGAQCRKLYIHAPISYTRRDTGEQVTQELTRSYWTTEAAEDFQVNGPSTHFRI